MTTPTRGSGGTFSRPTGRWLVLWGLGVWAAVAVFIRLFGGRLLDPTTPLVVLGFFVAVVPLMALVTYPVYRWLGVTDADRPAAAAIMSLPGLFLDVLLVAGAAQVFPNMSPGAAINFGAILLFGYAVVLMTGFLPRGRSGAAEAE